MLKKMIVIGVILVSFIFALTILIQNYSYLKIPHKIKNQAVMPIDKRIVWSSRINKLKKVFGKDYTTEHNINGGNTYYFSTKYNDCPMKITVVFPFKTSLCFSRIRFEIQFENPVTAKQYFYETRQQIILEFKETDLNFKEERKELSSSWMEYKYESDETGYSVDRILKIEDNRVILIGVLFY